MTFRAIVGTATDLAAALEVWRAANTARGKVPDAARVSRVRVKLVDPAATVLAATGDGATVGMLLAEPGRDDDGTGPVLAGLCHVSMVFVHPAHQGRRIGLALLDELAARSVHIGQTRLSLWTGQGNERARHLYRRAGFRPSGRVVRLATGEPVLNLVRDLG
jgi:ribosomal protein S18 acetylase RimI-like enzyme